FYKPYPLTLTNSIVAGNTANTMADVDVGADDLTARSSLIGTNDGTGLAPSPAAPDANGNLVGDAAGIDPGLEPLADNGGPMQTLALRADSPAIDRGDNALAVDVTQAGSPALTTDQRGDPFVLGFGPVDMGAFEHVPLVVDTAADEADGD